MAKTNIWMAFYPREYLGDTQKLSTQEHGAYLLLIFEYFISGRPLPDNDEDFARITRMPKRSWLKVRTKVAAYFKLSDNFWHHTRIDAELRRAQESSSKASAKAKKRWCPSNAAADAPAMPVDMLGICQSQSQSQYKHERESADRPSLKEVQEEAQRIGLAPWKAEDWFHEMEGCGWKDFQNREIAKWRPVLARVRTKWEADGRPMQPPTNAPRITMGTVRTLSPMDIKTIIAAKEQEANTIKQRYASETAIDTSWNNQGKRAEWIKLRGEIKALNNRLSKMA